MKHAVAVVGLGVMGQRMLANMSRYAGFEVVTAYDPQPEARQLTADRYPSVRVVSTAEEAIGADRITAVYVASPPTSHEEHALAAFDAGHAVWCEKPLGVDVEASGRLTEVANQSGQVNIVNFSLASAVATAEIERLLGEAALGDIVGVDLRIHFSKWPREWQVGAASWLALKHEGGFTREVVSHWVYLTERLFGAVTVESAVCRYPGGDACETHLLALLRTDELPVSIACTSGGVGPDLVEYTIRGSDRSARIVDWNRLFISEGDAWRAMREDIADPREAGYERQLANAAAAIGGHPHTMPDFAAALSVQRIIEQLLR